MKSFFTALVLLIMAAMPTLAQVRVGPLDGAAGPRLPAVGMPVLAAEEELPNTALPLALEKKGLLAAATLEWARLEWNARGAEREQALLKLAELSLKQNQPAAAAAYMDDLRAINPTFTPSAALLVAQAAASPAQKNAVLQQLTSLYPQDKTSVTARWADVWQQALGTGRVQQAWGLATATQLQQRLAFLNTRAKADYVVAVGLNVVPGLGHAYLGQWAAAGAMLLGWLMLGLAFASACRHRHYAYAFVWVVPLMGLWLNAPISAGMAADAAAAKTRAAAMAGWQDVRPLYISGYISGR